MPPPQTKVIMPQAFAVEIGALAETEALARAAAKLAAPGDIIALAGALGTGKTTFARFFVRALGGTEEVPSPTFNLVQVYDLPRGPVWHFDLYRLRDPQDAIELGIDEAISDGISLIEWPDRLGGLLPGDRLELTFDDPAGAPRRADLVGHGSWSKRAQVLAARLAAP
jgi:tRNA threonylcarbamoyladenosine biosynthesis protein TsaE